MEDIDQIVYDDTPKYLSNRSGEYKASMIIPTSVSGFLGDFQPLEDEKMALVKDPTLVPMDKPYLLLKRDDLKDIKDIKNTKDQNSIRDTNCGLTFNTKLGEGSFGAVWSVYSGVHNGNKLAFKQYILTNRQISDGIFNSKEMDIMSRLRHPYLMPAIKIVTPITQNCNKYGIVMPLGSGTIDSLFNKVYPLNNKLKHMYQMALGLKFLHQSGSIHGDLKPSNTVLLNGDIVISDFGLSQYIDVKNPDAPFNELLYTVDYRPPECFKQTVYGTKSDIWALGITFLSILAQVNNLLWINTPNRSDVGMYKYITDNFGDSKLAYTYISKVKGIQDPDIINLLTDMISYDHNKRPTIDQVLESKVFNTVKYKIPDDLMYLLPKGSISTWVPSEIQKKEIPSLMNQLVNVWSPKLKSDKYYQFTQETVYLSVDLFYRSLESKVEYDNLTDLLTSCLWLAHNTITKGSAINLNNLIAITDNKQVKANSIIIIIQNHIVEQLQGRLYRRYLWYKVNGTIYQDKAMTAFVLTDQYLNLNIDKWLSTFK